MEGSPIGLCLGKSLRKIFSKGDHRLSEVMAKNTEQHTLHMELVVVVVANKQSKFKVWPRLRINGFLKSTFELGKAYHLHDDDEEHDDDGIHGGGDQYRSCNARAGECSYKYSMHKDLFFQQ